MTEPTTRPSSASTAIAAGVGAGAFVLLLLAGYGLLASFLLGLLLFGGVLALVFLTGRDDDAKIEAAVPAKPAAVPAPEPARAEPAPAKADEAAPESEATPPAPVEPEQHSETAAEPEPESSPQAPEEKSEAQAETREAPKAKDSDAPRVKSGNQLAGQTELSGRKGVWKYEAPDAASSAASGPDGGRKPSTLDGPRNGSADDFEKIRGIGPKLAETLNGMGFYHYDQIAGWTPDEVRWVDANLEGFKGRVSRDDWVSQARALSSATDGTTG